MNYYRQIHKQYSLLTALTIGCILNNYIDCKSLPSPNVDVNSIDVQVSYFKQYGYLHNDFDLEKLRGYSKDARRDFEDAVREFQAMMGLPVTGILDKETLETMRLPRCGLPDKFISNTDGRQKRYAIFNPGRRLRGNNISFSIRRYTNDLPNYKTKEILKKSLQMWSKHANLDFYEETSYYNQATIRFLFGTRDHGDEYDFDGPGQVLAHAFPPIPDNENREFLADVHFDDDEEWSEGCCDGKNLEQVATHELGHSLGLNHSDVKYAVMSPIYRGYVSNFSLKKDDIDAIQYLYGARPTMAPPPPPVWEQPTWQPDNTPARPQWGQPWPPAPPPEPTAEECAKNYCGCAEIQAITTGLERKRTYAFYGEYVYEIDHLQNFYKNRGQPKKINQVFPNFTGKVDAALTWPKSPFSRPLVERIFLFQDYNVYLYYLYDNGNIIRRDKRLIRDAFPGTPGPVDAALVWSGNNRTYLMSGGKYYRTTTNGRGRIHSDYPRDIANWHLPNDETPSTGFQHYNTFTYFSFGKSYYMYNDSSIQVVEDWYPRNLAQWLFKCPSSVSDLIDENDTPKAPMEPWDRQVKDEISLNSDDFEEENSSTIVSHNVVLLITAYFWYKFV